MGRIPLIDLSSERKEATLDKIFSEFKKTYQSSQYVMGEPVKAFEKAYAKISGCEYGIGMNSGTDGLYLSLRAFGVGPGDEVITVSNSFVASVGAIAVIGAKPIMVDVDWDYNINPDLIEQAITKKTKAIIPVHLTGNPCKMDQIMAIAKKHNLHVVEDSAQAVGASYKGKKVGSWGDTAAFSLHPLKNLHVWGDGGMVTTNSEHWSKQLQMQRNHGLKNRDEVEFFSFNSRLDTLQAIVGLNSIPLLEETTNSRKRHAAIYEERLASLSDFVKRPIVDNENADHVFHLYVVVAKDRNKLAEHLLNDEIETKIHYPIPAHQQKAAAYLGYKKGDLPVTEELADGILSLPVRENLTDDEIHQVCDSVEKFYR